MVMPEGGESRFSSDGELKALNFLNLHQAVLAPVEADDSGNTSVGGPGEAEPTTESDGGSEPAANLLRAVHLPLDRVGPLRRQICGSRP